MKATPLNYLLRRSELSTPPFFFFFFLAGHFPVNNEGSVAVELIALIQHHRGFDIELFTRMLVN